MFAVLILNQSFQVMQIALHDTCSCQFKLQEVGQMISLEQEHVFKSFSLSPKHERTFQQSQFINLIGLKQEFGEIHFLAEGFSCLQTSVLVVSGLEGMKAQMRITQESSQVSQLGGSLTPTSSSMGSQFHPVSLPVKIHKHF